MTCPMKRKNCPYYNPKGGRFNTCILKNPAIQCADYITFEDDNNEEDEE